MAETDALSSFEFPKSKGLFTTFDDGDEYKVRVLTTDPMVTTKEFTSKDGEINLSTRFSFIIYNFTLERAQILSCGITITKEIQRIHQDPDFGSDIKKVDLKIRATGKDLGRKYTVNVLPKAETLTNEQIRECQAINLEEKIEDGQRMSFYKKEEKTGHDKAAEMAESIRQRTTSDEQVLEDITDEIDLSEIPF